MYSYAKFRAPGPTARGANLQRNGEGISSLSTGFFILKCDRNLIKNHEADFFALNVARSEGTIFDVSNSHSSTSSSVRALMASTIVLPSATSIAAHSVPAIPTIIQPMFSGIVQIISNIFVYLISLSFCIYYTILLIICQ